MKYTKEFVDLCSNWIRGSITDKSFFKDYQYDFHNLGELLRGF